MRVAIYLNSQISSFEYELIEYILNSQNMELSLLLIDAREKFDNESAIFKLQKKAEIKKFNFKSFDIDSIDAQKIYIKPINYKGYDVFDDNLSYQLLAYNIDLIINLTSSKIKGKFFKSIDRVISLNFDSGFNKEYATLFDIISGKKSSTIKLISQNKKSLKCIETIDIPLDKSFIKSNSKALKSGVDLIIKYLESKDVNQPDCKVIDTNLSPSFSDISKYIVNYYLK